MDAWIDRFLVTARIEKGHSENTIESYARDLTKFNSFLLEQTPNWTEDMPPSSVHMQHIQAFIVDQSKQGLDPKSISRSLSALRMFFKFLVQEGVVESPAAEPRCSLTQPMSS